MKALAKLGFSQSYSYFTWRTGKEELQKLSHRDHRAIRSGTIFAPNFLRQHARHPALHLQSGEPWMFKSRFALAATLSAAYGIPNGFELLEHEAMPGKEEYLDSEEYQITVRNWNAPGNIKDYIGWINRTRRASPALLQTSQPAFRRGRRSAT